MRSHLGRRYPPSGRGCHDGTRDSRPPPAPRRDRHRRHPPGPVRRPAARRPPPAGADRRRVLHHEGHPALAHAGDHRQGHRRRRRRRPDQRAVAVGGHRGRRAAAELPQPRAVDQALHGRGPADRRRPAQRPDRPAAEPVDRLPLAGERVDRADQGGPRRRERRGDAPADRPPAAVRDHGDARRDRHDRAGRPRVPARLRADHPARRPAAVRAGAPVARAQRVVPPRGRALLRPRRRDGHAHADHPRARPGGHRRGARRRRRRGCAVRRLPARRAQRPVRVAELGQPAAARRPVPRARRLGVDHRVPHDHRRPGGAAQLVLRAHHRRP